MLRNDLMLSLRRIRNRKLYSFLNIIGLSCSIAVSILIFHWSLFQLSFDEFHPDADRIFRIAKQTVYDNHETAESVLTDQFIGPKLRDDFAAVLESCQVFPTRHWFDCLLTNYDKNIIHNERNLYFADASFFDVFSFSFIYGDKEHALRNSYSAVITESASRRYFGDAIPIGKVLHLKGSFEENDYQVTGVIKDLPQNSHMDFDILLSASSLLTHSGFSNLDCYTYILLANDQDFGIVQDNLPVINHDGGSLSYELQPIRSIFLYSKFSDEIKSGGDFKNVFVLLSVALLILLIAWINYINLTASQAFERAKEVGIRKISGATGFAIARQFLVDALVMNLLSLSAAVGLVYVCRPAYFGITQIPFSWSDLVSMGNAMPALVVVSIVAFGIFFSGYFPSKILAALSPVTVLKGKFISGQKGLLIRKGLIVFQFSCSIILITGVFVIHQQLKFMQDYPLGIDINNTLVLKSPVNIDSTYLNRLADFRNEMRSIAIVESVTTSTVVPGERVEWTGRVRNLKEEHGQNFTIHVVDTSFINFYKLRLVAGRNFEVSDFPVGKFGSKLERIIVNHEAVRLLGFVSNDDALGRIVYWGDHACQIVGVIHNFHQESLKSALSPTLFTVNMGPVMSLRLGPMVDKSNFPLAVLQIHEAWKMYFPDNPFEPFSLRDFYHQQYKTDSQLRNALHIFSALAIITSCLGLLGMSVFHASQRIKEIGIRKVLGASQTSIVLSLSGQFLLLVILSGFLAMPVSVLVSENWLASFAFRIPHSIWYFCAPVLTVLLIAGGTVIIQTLKTSAVNPVRTLKHD